MDRPRSQLARLQRPGARSGATDAEHKLLQEVRDKLIEQLQRQGACYRTVIVPGLAAHGVYLRCWDELTTAQKNEASKHFDSELSPALTPLVIDPIHPFPFLSNLSASVVFRLHDPVKAETMFARVKVPGVLKQWVHLES